MPELVVLGRRLATLALAVVLALGIATRSPSSRPAPLSPTANGALPPSLVASFDALQRAVSR